MSKLLQDVVGELSKLPGVGRRTALRLAIHILRMERDSVAGMTESIDRFRNEIRYCSQCNNLSDEEVCPICADRERDHATICVVEQVADVLSVENTRQYRGMYHVLGRARRGEGGDPRHLDFGRRGDDAFLPDEPPAAVSGAESYVDRARHRFRRRTGICRRTDDHPRADEPPGDRVARPA